MMPCLVALSGLPGSGKSTIGRLAAERLGLAWIRIDTIEQALLRSGLPKPTFEGYAIAYEIARDLLRTGQSVIADSVNPVAATRQAWAQVAAETGARLIDVGVTCGDTALHRLRVESRTAEIAGHVLPTWAEVERRQVEPFPADALLLDTALLTPATCVDHIGKLLA